MTRTVDADRGHGGTCGFRGTAVKPDYITCTGCGAIWRHHVTAWGLLMVKGAWPAGLFLGFVSVGVFQSLGAAVVVAIGGAFGLAILGASVRTSAWYR